MIGDTGPVLAAEDNQTMRNNEGKIVLGQLQCRLLSCDRRHLTARSDAVTRLASILNSEPAVKISMLTRYLLNFVPRSLAVLDDRVSTVILDLNVTQISQS